MSGTPVAFMSYARFDDKHDDGHLTRFRELLSAEVRAQTGMDFAIFQDRNDIGWGQSWQHRIDETLDVTTLLLVIITPGLFSSPACRAEIERFIGRERALGRRDLILPLYYITAKEIEDPVARESDMVARVLASRQHADWRELRFKPLTSPTARKAIAQLAVQMRDTFWQEQAFIPEHHHQHDQAGSDRPSKVTTEATTPLPVEYFTTVIKDANESANDRKNAAHWLATRGHPEFGIDYYTTVIKDANESANDRKNAAHWLATHGHPEFGIDYYTTVIKDANESANDRKNAAHWLETYERPEGT
jgi:hypothetical protein